MPPPLSPVSQARANLQQDPAQMSHADLLHAYQRAVNQRNYAWRRICRLLNPQSNPKPKQKSIPLRTTHARAGSSDKSVQNRAPRDCSHQHVGVTTLRRSSARNQRADSARDLCTHLRTNHFTPKATLTLRLENFLPTRAIDRANTLLLKVQRDDGTWQRPVILPMPSGCFFSNRALGITSPLRMFNVLGTTQEVANALDDGVSPFGNLSIGGSDFNTA
eukprot:6005656-Pleurochrysis_carterae.AAC.1